MSVNRGKQFEAAIYSAFQDPKVLAMRLYDQTGGYLGVANICDFVIYRDPLLLLLECKSVHGGTLNFVGKISDRQWSGLLEKSGIPGVMAGIMVWFIDHDITGFVPIQELERIRQLGSKSLSVSHLLSDEVRWIPMPGKKLRVLWKYDGSNFLNLIQTQNQGGPHE